MPIKVGDKLPSVKLKQVTAEAAKETTPEELFAGKKAVLFAVPGAFTPTCSAKHLPGFVAHADAFKAKGVDIVACIAVNDAFVMKAWGKDQNVGDKVVMLADGNGDFAKAVDMVMDGTANGMGLRSRRWAMIIEDNVVKALHLEEPGAFEVSSAEAILRAL